MYIYIWGCLIFSLEVCSSENIQKETPIFFAFCYVCMNEAIIISIMDIKRDYILTKKDDIQFN